MPEAVGVRFGISVMVRRADFHPGEAAVSFWSRATDSGRTLTCAFCPACGSRLWHQGEDPAEPISVKGGSLDTPPDLSAAVHIWTARRLSGVVIPDGARQFPGEPE